MKQDYYLGLDMGTNSVGWAVTDSEYKLLRAKGKDLWGVRIFPEAEVAEGRRQTRISRRRRQRQQVRIGLVRSYFHDAIAAVDPNFYQRMDNSFFKVEDKDDTVKSKYALFNDPNYTDQNYFHDEATKTAFHLRSELIHNPAPHDVRLVYLAVLNIFKHRGHFLNPGLSVENTTPDIRPSYESLRAMLEESCGLMLPENPDFDEFLNIMSNRATNRTKKSEDIAALLGVEKKQKELRAVLDTLCGRKVDARKFFLELQNEDKIDLEFPSASFDDSLGELESKLGDEYFQIVLTMKQLYDTCIWNSVIKGHEYLSDARIDLYNKHHEDLKTLKALFRKYKTPEEYDQFFRSEEKGSYGHYVGSNNDGENKHRRGLDNKPLSQEDFCKSVKAKLKGVEDPIAERILAECEQGTFMPKQMTRSNGVIPYQAHYKELQAILKNAEAYLPFLKEYDPEAKLTTTEKILALFKFNIPYFVGPVSTNSKKDGGNGWVVRNEDGPVLPWNFEEKVNIHATQEEFINNLIRTCTYISNERVLPRKSLRYERYAVLNEINAIAIDGERIPPELKQAIYTDLFTRGRAVTKKAIAKYLINQGKIESETQVTGIDIRVNSTLGTYRKCRDIFGAALDTDEGKALAERIIYLCTVLGESKSYLKNRLHQEYGDTLTDKQIKQILALNCKDWGKLSKAFLELQGINKETGEVLSISQALWDTNCTLMELIHSPLFTFGEELEKKTTSKLSSLQDLQISDLDDMYFSAPVKRMVWQTLLIIRELEQVLGHAPKRVFVEMTRSSGEKVRTTSRKNKFLDLYKSIKDEDHNWAEIIATADANGKIRSKKMYLYLLQQGRDLYTGKAINLDDLFNNNIYDIDHIYPQSLVKDDNLDNNMVLVNKSNNNQKQDTYPINASIQKQCYGLWKMLHEKGFMNDVKFQRLTSRQELTDEQLAGFIARQMVETGQGTKAVSEILKTVLPEPDTTIVYSKASVVSDFRNKYSLPKSRILNDLHHAHDAYLNIVCGNSYYVKFTANPYKFISENYRKDKEKYRYNLAKFFERDVKRGNETAWIGSGKVDKDTADKDLTGTILTVKETLAKPSPLMSSFVWENHGGISDQTIAKAEVVRKGIGYLPLKGSDDRFDPRKYGGFPKAATAYFFLVESTVKGKRVRTIEGAPIYLADAIKKNPDVLEQYCTEQLGLIDPDIRLKKIMIRSLVRYNGYDLLITGRTGPYLTTFNATNLFLSSEETSYIKKIENYVSKGVLEDGIFCIEKNIALYNTLSHKHNSGVFNNRPNSIGKKLSAGTASFKELTLEDQLALLYEILSMSSPSTNGAGNLKKIGFAEHTGVMLLPKKMDSSLHCILIHKSVTGLFERKIDLLKV